MWREGLQGSVASGLAGMGAKLDERVLGKHQYVLCLDEDSMLPLMKLKPASILFLKQL